MPTARGSLPTTAPAPPTAIPAHHAPTPGTGSERRTALTDPAARDQVRSHLRWLAAAIDDPGLSPQLLTLRYELMAADATELRDDLADRASQIDATLRIDEDLT